MVTRMEIGDSRMYTVILSRYWDIKNVDGWIIVIKIHNVEVSVNSSHKDMVSFLIEIKNGEIN